MDARLTPWRKLRQSQKGHQSFTAEASLHHSRHDGREPSFEGSKEGPPCGPIHPTSLSSSRPRHKLLLRMFIPCEQPEDGSLSHKSKLPRPGAPISYRGVGRSSTWEWLAPLARFSKRTPHCPLNHSPHAPQSPRSRYASSRTRAAEVGWEPRLTAV